MNCALVLAIQITLQHVNVVDVERGRILPDQTVVIAGNRIAQVGPAASVRPSGPRVDATGKYLIPGLWDMHAHPLHRKETHIPAYVAAGVTGFRSMHSREPLAASRAYRLRVLTGEVLAPRFVMAGPLVDGPVPTPFPGSLIVRTPEEARRTVDSLAHEGADFIKPYSRLSRASYLALADQAKRRGLWVAGHWPSGMSSTEVSSAGQRSIEHALPAADCYTIAPELPDVRQALAAARAAGDSAAVARLQMRFDSLAMVSARSFAAGKCAELGRVLARNNTWYTPTLIQLRPFVVPLDSLLEDARLDLVPLAVRTPWIRDARARTPTPLQGLQFDTRAQATRALLDAGVGILAGTDSDYSTVMAFSLAGFGVHDEMELMVRAGLSAAEALRTATLNPARYLAATDSLGTVAPGRIADLVLLEANPLQNIRNTQRIAAVILNGRYLDRKALDDLLAPLRGK